MIGTSARPAGSSPQFYASLPCIHNRGQRLQRSRSPHQMATSRRAQDRLLTRRDAERHAGGPRLDVTVLFWSPPHGSVFLGEPEIRQPIPPPPMLAVNEVAMPAVIRIAATGQPRSGRQCMRCASAPLPIATDVNGDHRGMLGSGDRVAVAGNVARSRWRRRPARYARRCRRKISPSECRLRE
jgi:hypothetical protein